MGSCAAPSAKGDDKFITTDYLQQCQRLYTEAATSDFAALAQTAHRLKGVFAMLNLVPGKQLCETLEHLIREKDAPGIEKYISDIDAYVKSLL
nr:Hpt domain-containing protein [Salmonella enterica]